MLPLTIGQGMASLTRTPVAAVPFTPSNVTGLVLWVKTDVGLSTSNSTYAGTGTIGQVLTTVNGTGTKFTTESVVADKLSSASVNAAITVITNDTTATVDTSGAAAGEVYNVAPQATTLRVGTWSDQSSAADDLSQATGKTKPTKNIAIQNALDAVLFNGLSHLLTLGTNIDATVSSVFLVLNKLSAGSGSKLVLNLTKYAIILRNSFTNQWGVRLDVDQLSGSTINTTFAQLSVVIRAANDIDLVTNGTLANVTGASTFQALGGNALGGDATTFADCNVGELLVYNAAVSSANRLLIESYLKTKWGTP